MSEENVEIVLDAYARFNAGEKTPQLWFWHPDAEYHAAREDPDSAVHRGIGAVRRQFASWLDAYPDLRVEVLDAGGTKTWCCCGSASLGMERQVESRSTWSWPTSTPCVRARPPAWSST